MYVTITQRKHNAAFALHRKHHFRILRWKRLGLLVMRGRSILNVCDYRK